MNRRCLNDSCRIINNRQLFIHRSETLTAFSFYWIVLRLTERILLSLSGLFLPSRICVLAIWITRYQRQSSFISTMGLLIFFVDVTGNCRNPAFPGMPKQLGKFFRFFLKYFGKLVNKNTVYVCAWRLCKLPPFYNQQPSGF